MAKKKPKTSAELALDLDAQRLKLIGMVIRRARESLRYSYRELEQLSGVSASHLLRMESGEFEYSLVKFLRVAEPLGLSVGVVLESVMFRRIRRVATFNDLNEIERLVKRLKITDEAQIENAVFVITDLSAHLAEVLISISLSSNPQQYAASFDSTYPAAMDAVCRYVDESPNISTGHSERVALQKALLDRPFAKLMEMKILTPDFLKTYLEWALADKKAGLRDARFNPHWLTSLVQSSAGK